VTETNSESTADEEVLPELEIQTSDLLTVYNSKSEIKNPLLMFRNIAADFWSGRELGWRLFLRNIRGLYRQTFLGLFWAFLPPIANTAIWVFLRRQGVFKLGGNMDVDGTVYILTGMILWQTFIEAFQMPLKVVNQNRGMISKLRFPRESLLLVGLGEVLFDFAIRCLLLIPAFWFFNVTPTIAIFAAIPLALLMVLFASGLGMLIRPSRSEPVGVVKSCCTDSRLVPRPDFGWRFPVCDSRNLVFHFGDSNIPGRPGHLSDLHSCDR